ELPLVITSAKAPAEERFEISQHAYRLEQSRCFRESGGRLSCLTCHDPHRLVPAEERAAHYRQVCLGCHDVIAAGGRTHTAPDREQADCAGCHMPKRRTHDVVHVVMTDHRIGRLAGGPELLAPREERDPPFDTVGFFDPSSAPGGTDGELYRLLPLMRAGLNLDPASTAHLSSALAKAPPEALEPLLDLANAQASQQQWARLEATCRTILERSPEHPLALAWLGLARGGLGDKEQAIALQRRAVALEPDRAGFHFNLALALLSGGRDGEAIAELERATALRPTLPAAWLHLAEIRARHSEPAAAIIAYKRALALEPGGTRAYVGLGRTLISQGDRKAARRLWQHALTTANDRKAIERVLNELRIEN
ncbi:MAG: tetratricopeptide repeat protein, partial [Acidobacteriota bacterium]